MYFDFAGLERGHDLRTAAEPWPHLRRKQSGSAVNPGELVCSSGEAQIWPIHLGFNISSLTNEAVIHQISLLWT